MYDFDLYGFAKDILSSIKETEFNKEIINSWKEVKKGCEKEEIIQYLKQNAEDIEFEEIIETNNNIKLLQ